MADTERNSAATRVVRAVRNDASELFINVLYYLCVVKPRPPPMDNSIVCLFGITVNVDRLSCRVYVFASGRTRGLWVQEKGEYDIILMLLIRA